MKVIDVMTGTPFYCSPNTNLGPVAELLWNQNCGILPIVDDQKVVGDDVLRTLKKIYSQETPLTTQRRTASA